MKSIFAILGDTLDLAALDGLAARAGFSLAVADPTESYVWQVATLHPQLVLVDFTSGIDGRIHFCRQLKANPRTSRIPIAILTDRGDESQIRAGIEAGADDHVCLGDPALIFAGRLNRLANYGEMIELSLHNQRLIQVGRLLTGIVHEIRGPLSVIRGHGELLRILVAGNQESLGWVDQILHHSGLMQTRLANLMSAVRAGSATPEMVGIVDVIAEAVDFFEKNHDRRGSRIQVATVFQENFGPAQREFKVDSAKFLLVLLNILNNALESLQSAMAEGVIKIRLAPAKRKNLDGIQIEVIDDGPGIPEAVIGHIFKPFFSTKGEGSGYGLFLSSEILAEMGGTIEASNSPDGGACFTIWLPTDGPPLPVDAVRSRLGEKPE